MHTGFRTCRVLSVCLSFLFLICILCSPSWGANLGNIMPLGDSITWGVGADGGYRDPLYTKLTAHGDTFTFVGSLTDNPTNTLTTHNETRQEGHPGYVIQHKDPSDPNPTGSERGGIYDNIPVWLGSGGPNPQYILLMIGTNDVDLGYAPATQGDRLSNLISAISNRTTGARPSAHLIVAQITPTEDAAENLLVQKYNAEVATAVAEHQALGENVTMVNMYDALTPNSSDFSDALHPSATGYTKMADVWFAGIEAVPEPSSLAIFGMVGFGVLQRRKRRSHPTLS